MKSSEVCQIRDANAGDANFILATFLRGVYYGNDWYRKIPKNVFMPYYKDFMVALLSGGKAQVKIACLIEDPDVIVGYSILSTDFTRVHWVYVKAAWRNNGIGKSLVPTNAQACTHLTKLGDEIRAKYPNMIFNPFVF